MTRKRKIRGAYSFAIAMAAALAVVVGAVRFWGIPGDELTRTLIAIVMMVVGLAFLALFTVATIKLISRWLKR